MKKVLILTYFFPPCNLAAAQRVWSWAQHLHQANYYPVIVTRNWEIPISASDQVLKSTGTKVEITKNHNYEVHYLPYRSSLRDKIFIRSQSARWLSPFSKLLTLITLFLQNITNSVIPHGNLYSYAATLLSKDRELEKLVVSGNPFELFKFGYLLHKKNGIRWVADYRDAWTSTQLGASQNPISKIITSYDRYFEKKWVRTASCITSVSTPLVDHISKVSAIEGEAVYNGFESDDFNKEVTKYDDFTITYLGTLYPEQNIEVFCKAFKEFVDAEDAPRVRLNFCGLDYDKHQSARVASLLVGYEPYYESSERIPRDQVITMEMRSHLLLYVGWKGFRGVIGSKIYEYAGSGTPIALCPGDGEGGEAEKVVRSLQHGGIANSSSEMLKMLRDHYQLFMQGKSPANDKNAPGISQYSRRIQAEALANILDQI